MLGKKEVKRSWFALKIAGFIFALLFASFLSACNPLPDEPTGAELEATQEAIITLVAVEISNSLATKDAMATQVAEQVNATVAALSSQMAETASAEVVEDDIDSSNNSDNATDEDEPDEGSNAEVDGILDEEATAGGNGDAPITAILSVNANVRTGPGTNYQYITTSTTGTSLKILGKNCSGCSSDSIWYKVELPNGNEGWTISWAFNSNPDLANVAVVAVPPPPQIFPTVTHTATATPSPTQTAVTTATPTPTPGNTLTVIVLNKSTSSICQLLIHPSTKTSEENRLGLDPLLPDSQIVITLTEGATVYDFEARACGDNSLVKEENEVQVTNNFVWTIE